MRPLNIDCDPLSIPDVLRVAREGQPVRVGPQALIEFLCAAEGIDA